METVKLNKGNFYFLLALLALSLLLIEYGGLVEDRGALLMTLVFWTGLLQGAVAVAAVADLVGAKWIASLRRELLSTIPLLAVPLLLMLALWPQMEAYPWTGEPGLWLNKPFFLGRNLLSQLLCLGAAVLFARRSLEGHPQRQTFAVLYLFLFTAAQTLLAFDWVMSLEYPWYSTLFGAYFMVEALYAGLALSGLFLFFLIQEKAREDRGRTEATLRDLGMLLFGFSILWTGLFFAQYLLLWYGNLPEEVAYIARRVGESPYREVSLFFLAANFLVPFLVLISRKAKESPAVVSLVSLVILAGLFAERLFFIQPALPLNTGSALLQTFLVTGVLLLAVQSRDRLLPETVSRCNPEEDQV